MGVTRVGFYPLLLTDKIFLASGGLDHQFVWVTVNIVLLGFILDGTNEPNKLLVGCTLVALKQDGD